MISLASEIFISEPNISLVYFGHYEYLDCWTGYCVSLLCVIDNICGSVEVPLIICFSSLFLVICVFLYKIFDLLSCRWLFVVCYFCISV